MPPLTRPSICGLQAAFSSCRISSTTTKTIITSTITTSSPWRAFSTTPFAAGPVPVPPESPRFITVPEPPQSAEPKLAPIKGHLPVPRDIFPKREGKRKVTQSYIASATPVSKAELAGEPPKNEHDARRRRMAAARRSAFAAGIQGLYVRKKQRVQRAAARSEAHRKANLAAAMAPEGLDDVLTRPTVRSSTASTTTVAPDPARFEAADAARERHAALLARKSESRRDALAQMYVAAQGFIVDEAELEARVSALFKEDSHKYGGMDHGVSIWDQQRAPISVTKQRADLQGAALGLVDAARSSATKTTQRQKTVAEELTGGKL